MVDRTEDGWGEPQRVTDQGDFYASLTDDGIIYFTDAHNDLYRAPLENGRPADREKLGDSINTEAAEYNSYVALDESFLLFTSNGWDADTRAGILYVSYRDTAGNWSRPVNLGSGVNRGTRSYCPSLSPDGQYLFFALRDGAQESIYWVDAALIDSARESDLNFEAQIVGLLLDSDLTAFEERYHEFETRMSRYCDLDAVFLERLANRLIGMSMDVEAAGLLRLTTARFPGSDSPVRNLKLALLDNDDIGWQSALAGLQSDTTLNAENEINALGYLFLFADRTEEALRLFAKNAEFFPASANVFDSYGEALLAAGDTTGSIENYRRALDMDSTNVHAARILERLGQD